MVDLVPDPAVRSRALPAMFAASCGDALRLGHVYVEAGAGLRGVAVWLPPGHHRMSSWRRLRAVPDGLRILIAAPRSFPRTLRYMEAEEALHPRAPHWYLESVGVDPAFRHQGIGRRVLEPVLRMASERGEPCYLATAVDENVGWYRGLGFEVRDDDVRLTPGGPRTWTMWRPPRSEGARIG
jgi:GNAT superfamily N-acetyltransferase